MPLLKSYDMPGMSTSAPGEGAGCSDTQQWEQFAMSRVLHRSEPRSRNTPRVNPRSRNTCPRHRGSRKERSLSTKPEGATTCSPAPRAGLKGKLRCGSPVSKAEG